MEKTCRAGSGPRCQHRQTHSHTARKWGGRPPPREEGRACSRWDVTLPVRRGRPCSVPQQMRCLPGRISAPTATGLHRQKVLAAFPHKPRTACSYHRAKLKRRKLPSARSTHPSHLHTPVNACSPTGMVPMSRDLACTEGEPWVPRRRVGAGGGREPHSPMRELRAE